MRKFKVSKEKIQKAKEYKILCRYYEGLKKACDNKEKLLKFLNLAFEYPCISYDIKDDDVSCYGWRELDDDIKIRIHIKLFSSLDSDESSIEIDEKTMYNLKNTLREILKTL